MKPLIEQLASSLGRADEAPNIALAEKISKGSDKHVVQELIGLLSSSKTAIRSDAIKVVYELAERKPDLIIPYYEDILALLSHKDNRLKWGAMAALSAIARKNPVRLVNHLSQILEAMDTGSVITRDNGIKILCEIARLPRYHKDCMELMMEQIERAPVNQVAMYAERMAEAVSSPYIKKLVQALQSRKDVLEIESKKKRIEKLIRILAARS